MQAELDLFPSSEPGLVLVLPAEEWRVVVGFPRYECSTLGRFRNRFTGKILSGNIAHNGYRQICLIKDGRPRTLLAHIVIAKTWLHQPSPLHEVVNHKDISTGRADNRVSNLEWVTRSYNARHGWEYKKSGR